jgi:hypothetical protein
MSITFRKRCRAGPIQYWRISELGWEFPTKNNPAEDGIGGTNGYFQRNSGSSAEQKILGILSEPFRGRENNSELCSVEQQKKQTFGIPFRALQRKTKQLGILFRGTKIEANSRNSVPNHSAEEKQLGTKSGSLSQFSN